MEINSQPMSDNEVNMAMTLEGVAIVIGIVVVAIILVRTIRSWREGNSIKAEMYDEVNKLKMLREE
jgi:uncharacterized membrane-anchored protein YhcB (DUF1043 family)